MAAIHVRGEGGAVIYFDVETLPEGVAHRIAKGELVRVNPDGSPWAESGAAPEPADVPPPDAPPLPKRAATRAAWTEFAVSQGMDREQAASMSKAELIDEFTRLRVAS